MALSWSPFVACKYLLSRPGESHWCVDATLVVGFVATVVVIAGATVVVTLAVTGVVTLVITGVVTVVVAGVWVFEVTSLLLST